MLVCCLWTFPGKMTRDHLCPLAPIPADHYGQKRTVFPYNMAVTLRLVARSSRKTEEAARYDIVTQCYCHAAAALPIDELCLCLILGNALDNAIEACRALPEGAARQIDIDMQYRDDRLTIRIANTSAPVCIMDNRCETGKKDRLSHGYGLENIHRAVGANGGNAVVRYADGMFVLSVLILKGS